MRSVSQLAKTAESSVAPIAAVGYPSSHTNIPANTNRVATYSATYTVTWMPSRSGSLPEATPSIIANAAARHAGTPKPPLWNSLSGWGAVGRPYSWGHASRVSHPIPLHAAVGGLEFHGRLEARTRICDAAYLAGALPGATLKKCPGMKFLPAAVRPRPALPS